ncbi:MAG: DHA2 family efflux MFS transporter permease subunit [Pseudonocardia sp.]|uniref:DHA2 family efflux MFS transporter permease subunit n=1 Tax=Pseudonocardia sp. TaxID=60912 RepID=UPI001AC8856A|nr:DHA2 family efflux MFS transporter permease subunit [Pseudonocardia sp.]MBN9097667.1 DHA2 family efflux MFS transporter permease subunit [Pseudonocardia sp.]
MDGSRRWWGLVAISLGVALIIVDTTIVNVAIPAVIKDLGISSSQAQWVQESYAVVFAALLLVAGRLADAFGRRRVFLAGTVVFVAASVLAALAPDGNMLVASRFLQGLGGSVILPTSLSLINSTFRGKERGQAFAIWGSTIGGAAALGPLLGGWLTTEFSWRWSFGINVPIGVLIVAGVLLFVAPTPRASGPVDLDPLGALLSIIGFGGLAFGLIEGRSYGWWSPLGEVSLLGLSPVSVAFAVAALALTGFGAHALARRRAGRPGLVDLDLFTIPSFRNGNVASAIISLGEFGILFALPLWLQNALGYDAFETGLLLLALAVGSFAASGAGAVLTERIGPLQMVRLGLVLEIVGVGGLGLTVSPTTSAWTLAPLLAVYGVGVGLATAQITNVVLADVPVELSGTASGVQSTARQIGSALGIAVLGTVLFTGLAAQTRSGLTAAGLPAPAVDGLAAAVTNSAGAVIGPLAADPATAGAAGVARQALSGATATSALVAAGALVLGLLASLRIRSAERVSG